MGRVELMDEELHLEEVRFGRCAPRWGDAVLWAEGAYIRVGGMGTPTQRWKVSFIVFPSRN